jgi:amidase
LDELATLDASAQAETVRRGEVGRGAFVEAAIARLERLDPTLGVLVARLYEQASADLRELDPAAPFAGVPFLMKDLGACFAGQPYYAGNRALLEIGYKAPAETYLARRFRQAGLIAIATAKTPEFGLQSTTQPLAFGPAHNPWSLAHTPGGSSGGSAAAVAAGIVPFAHANDGAGSIRIPAAWCGVVGLKPSRGRIALEPTTIGRSLVGFAITRSVRDAAALLDAVHGNEPGDLYRLPPPVRPFARELGADPGRLRVGLLTELPGEGTHPEAVAAAESAARLLEALGHRVERSGPAALFEEERAWHGLVFGPVEYRLCLRELGRMLGRAVREDDVEPYLWTLADPHGPSVSPEEYLEAAAAQQAWAVRVASWWAGGYDLLLTPTVAEPPPRLAELDGRELAPLALLERMAKHMAFTEPFNVTGHPAISLPLHWTVEGLPLGVQLVARVGREDLLLRVAAQLEEAAPWARRAPRLEALEPAAG